MPKLHQIRSLLEKFIPGAKNDRLMLNAVHVKNSVLGSDGKITNTLKPGDTYGHTVEMVRNYAIWPIKVDVQSTITSSEQISFQSNPRRWDFVGELLPNHGLGPRTEIIYCRSRTSGKEEILTRFTLSSGHTDTMTLEIEVE